MNHVGTKCEAFGSMVRYKLINEYSVSSSFQKDVLFCSSPFNIGSFRSLLTNYSDMQSHQINDEILSLTKKYSVDIDIKLHPQDQDFIYDYYKKLCNFKKYNKTQIIYNVPLELIASKYKLIILDYLGSAIVTYILSLNIPVILYNRDFDVLDVQVKKDLENRCYVVNNFEVLCDIMQRYLSGKLPNKSSKKFIDSYVYPVDGGDPGERIANYIREII